MISDRPLSITIVQNKFSWNINMYVYTYLFIYLYDCMYVFLTAVDHYKKTQKTWKANLDKRMFSYCNSWPLGSNLDQWTRQKKTNPNRSVNIFYWPSAVNELMPNSPLLYPTNMITSPFASIDYVPFLLRFNRQQPAIFLLRILFHIIRSLAQLILRPQLSFSRNYDQTTKYDKHIQYMPLISNKHSLDASRIKECA